MVGLGEIRVTATRPEHAEQLEALQRLVFPTLDPKALLRREHYLHHVRLFPEGQFVALDGERVVGMTTSMRVTFDFAHPQHHFDDFLCGGWLTAHEPAGPWLYGIDMGTHPDYRKRGIAKALYAARHDTVRRLGLLGQLTVGMLSGYGAVQREVSAAQYYDAVVCGERWDPTVSAQMRVGFEPRGLVAGYLDDPVCAGYGALIVLPADKPVH